MKKLTLVVAAAFVALFAGALYADDYPTRPITMVAVFGPGSASDTICRIIADKFSPALGQPVVVEDRPGADGALAALYVHHQPADGYTLLMATNSPLSADPFLHKDVNYDPVKDFAPVTRVGSFTLMLVVNPKLPIHSVKELVDYAKANPGKLSFASGNTAGIVAGDTLAKWAGISMLHVPYKSTPPALEDIIAGRVSMMFADFTTAMPHVAAGTLRRARGHAHQAQLAVPRSADHGRGRRQGLQPRRLGGPGRAGRHAARRRRQAQRRRCARSSTAPTCRRNSRTSASRAFPRRPTNWATTSRPSSSNGEDGQGRQHPVGLSPSSSPVKTGEVPREARR